MRLYKHADGGLYIRLNDVLADVQVRMEHNHTWQPAVMYQAVDVSGPFQKYGPVYITSETRWKERFRRYTP